MPAWLRLASDARLPFAIWQVAGTHTAMLDRSFWMSLDFWISSLQSMSSLVQKGWLQKALS